MTSAARLALLLPLVACASGDSNAPPGGIPAATAFVTTAVVGGEIQVSWPAVAGATSYNIYMASESGVTRVNVATLAGNMSHPGLQTSFDHPAGLDQNTTYYFVVTAQNSAGHSLESCEVTATIGTAQGETC